MHSAVYAVAQSSSSRMRVIYHNWSATKQRPHPQSVAQCLSVTFVYCVETSKQILKLLSLSATSTVLVFQ